MMDWVPVVFVIFKFLVLGIGMFFAIKWHYDQGKKGRQRERGEVLRASAKVAVGFVLALVVLAVVTFVIGRKLGLDLNFS
jgi:heme/copper-type cytochrome/quinol oxidase subunit 2